MFPPSSPPLTPELLLRGYMSGIFPMAESRTDPEVFWVDPKRRGILPLDGVHVSRSLRKTMRTCSYRLSLDTSFAAVVDGCADRDETWINAGIYDTYIDLHQMGYAHSIELWEETHLVGGVYGVAIAGAFFGESMFSRSPDASKIALVCLAAHLRTCGFALFDTQFVTPHLHSMGALEISRDDYRSRLKDALSVEATLDRQPLPETPAAFLAPQGRTP
ncbi:leucyl/phenylalanyl-tRNA--protein transferase [Tropicimonas sp. S265A]|uniref:leucyl/phenylalanyl-tRNA--protein transferase n=1 Tax=Tropicimonas sp. S265A TaxID=3415134 RepID=UPI003C7B48D0